MKIYAQDYEYGGMLAETLDLLRGDTSQWPDRFFYRELIKKHGEPVLDVGCGTGRLLLDYLAEGVDIEGVDNSPEMLDLCREKGKRLCLVPVLYEHSMVDLDLPRRYRIIIVPSSSFQLVTEIGEARRTMTSFFRHLESGGLLIMPFMVLRGEGELLVTGWIKDGEKDLPQQGAAIRRWSRVRYDLKEQLEYTETRFERLTEGEIVSSEYHTRLPATRWYTQQQARELFMGAGFIDLQLYREFSLEPARDGDKIFSVVGVRPEF